MSRKEFVIGRESGRKFVLEGSLKDGTVSCYTDFIIDEPCRSTSSCGTSEDFGPQVYCLCNYYEEGTRMYSIFDKMDECAWKCPSCGKEIYHKDIKDDVTVIYKSEKQNKPEMEDTLYEELTRVYVKYKKGLKLNDSEKWFIDNRALLYSMRKYDSELDKGYNTHIPSPYISGAHREPSDGEGDSMLDVSITDNRHTWKCAEEQRFWAEFVHNLARSPKKAIDTCIYYTQNHAKKGQFRTGWWFTEAKRDYCRVLCGLRSKEEDNSISKYRIIRKEIKDDIRAQALAFLS